MTIVPAGSMCECGDIYQYTLEGTITGETTVFGKPYLVVRLDPPHICAGCGSVNRICHVRTELLEAIAVEVDSIFAPREAIK